MKYEKIMKQLKSFNFTDAQRKKLASIILKLDKEKQDILVSGDNIATINGQSLLNGGNISLIKTGIFTIVTELPTNDIDKDKVYLVPSTKTDNENKFSEYIYTDNGWEKLGEFKADVNLEPYKRALHLPSDVIKTLGVQSGANYVNVYSYKEDLDRGILSEVSEFDIPKATSNKAGIITAQDKAKLDGIEEGAQVNTIESISVNGTPLEVTDKGVNIPNATTEKDGMMSKADKTKLDSLNNYTLPVATKTTLGGVKVPTNIFRGSKNIKNHICINNGEIGANFELSYNKSNKRINFIICTTSGGGVIDTITQSIDCTDFVKDGPKASITENGVMSKEDKAKLDSQPTIKANNATGVTDDDYIVIKKSELNSILSRLSALENKA